MSDGDSKGAGGTGVGAGRVLRRRTVEEWERIVQESFTSPLAVREVARRHGVSASQLSRRRSRARRDELRSAEAAYVPVSVQESGGGADVTIEGRGVTVRLEGEIDAAGIAAIAVALAVAR